jgi:23S rRNA (uridine2552-2'-O)-methyltransferase
MEIDGKFGLFGKVPPKILDLGAAPGSWSLYILRRFAPAPGGELRLAAADLQGLSRRFDKGVFDRKDFFFIQGDLESGPVREALSGRGPYTVLLSDAAPGTTGNRIVDTGKSLALAEQVLEYADACLAPGGNMAIKVFQGAGSEDLLERIRERFTAARSFKPKACRSDSFETYFLGLGKK